MIKVKVASEVTVDDALSGVGISATAALNSGESFVYVERAGSESVKVDITMVAEKDHSIGKGRNLTVSTGSITDSGTDFMPAGLYETTGTTKTATITSINSNKDVTLTFTLTQP